MPGVESLEVRALMAGSLDDAPLNRPTNTNIADVKNGPLSIAGSDLITIHNEYKGFISRGIEEGFRSSLSNVIRFDGNFVGTTVNGFGNFDTLVAGLRNVGFRVTATNPAFRIVEGFLPIGQMVNVAQQAQVVSLRPHYIPINNQQGIANNQGDDVLNGPNARTAFNVDGRGVTVGVLSDSVSRLGGGLADSVRTGDLPGSVNVLRDGDPGDSDEGRAMLEQIHDIAPGANLAFHTAGGSEQEFADGIRALYSTGSRVIVDDVRFFAEPMFQDGIIAQAAIDVVNRGAIYFSSAGNSSDRGYASNFRGTNATIAGLGAGRYMDFDPGPGVLTGLPVTTSAGTGLVFQYDNPFYTTNGVTSDLDIFVLDASGAPVGAGGINNNRNNQQPLELINGIPAGSYTIVIRVNAGSPDVNLVRFQETRGQLNVSQQFGAAGGTTYPTTYGHAVANEAIGVGAVPFFGAPPFSSSVPILNEDFSSDGPVTIVFDPAGNRLPGPQLRLKPDLSGPDGNNTSFFGQDIPQDPDTLPNFFGTSSAAPNLAAVAALMRQLAPNASPGELRAALVSSAIPLNGAAQGAFNVRGGFGLVDAVGALSAIDQLRVFSTNPNNGATVQIFPTAITINFSKPINPDTLQASDLIFTSLPPGVLVQIGTPSLNGARTVATFPLTLIRSPGASANGNYTFALAAGSVTSVDGRPLLPFQAAFQLADTIAPRVVSTSLDGRRLRVQFSEPVEASGINLGSISLRRAGNGTPVSNPDLLTYPINVNDTPGAVVSYDPNTRVATVDYSALPQTALPTDNYQIIVLDNIVDVAGNRLDGEFIGRLPSGNGAPGGSLIQSLGLRTLLPPVITSLRLSPFLPDSDSGIENDQNTNDIQPSFIGQISSSFPGTLSGLLVRVEFNGLTPGNGLSLGSGSNGRGTSGNFQLEVRTDANGTFRFRAPAALTDGLNRVRVVVLGQQDIPGQEGLAGFIESSFRIDTTSPQITGSTIGNNALISNLSSLSLFVADPVLPGDPNSPLAVPTQLSFSALDPSTVLAINNFRLVNESLGFRDFSDRITSVTFTPTTNRVSTSQPYTGRLDFTFDGSALPVGRYLLILNSSGIRDSAGNALDGNTSLPGTEDFFFGLNVQNEAVYIRQVLTESPNPAGGNPLVNLPRSFFEVPGSPDRDDVPAPPTAFVIDFSGPLNPASINDNVVQLVASANIDGGRFDGDFGTLGITNTGGFSRVPNTRVLLLSTNPNARAVGDAGFNDRLVLLLNGPLPPENYRLYLPNNTATGTDIRGVFTAPNGLGNQLDGENLGNLTADGFSYEVQLQDGTFRQGISGDRTPGGAFMTGYTVVPYGHVLYARPDAVDDPFLPGDDPDGSLTRPFSALAPEAVASGFNSFNANGQVNFGTGFNTLLDRNGNGRFDRSAFVAAEQRTEFGPVVIVALPGSFNRNPVTQIVEQQTFVLTAPLGNDRSVESGSASVPDFTLLSFAAGSTLKLSNASLYVQNQGSAIQALGGPEATNRVTFTSLLDDTIGGDTNNDGDYTRGGDGTLPTGGNWGGIVLRNFDNASLNRTNAFPIDGDGDNLSGADDAMSTLNFINIRYAGGAVPQTIGTRFDAITLFNSRPSVSNADINFTGPAQGSQAAVSGDLDSFREDDLTRGPLIRRLRLANNSLNGLLVRSEVSGIAQQTDAIIYPTNILGTGGSRNFVFDDPTPYLLLTPLHIGQTLQQNTGGVTNSTPNRLYIQPGMMLKSRNGAGIQLISPSGGGIATAPSLNVGDRFYINQFDANPNAAPDVAGFRPNSIGDAKVLFTSLYDDAASTFFDDPNQIDPANGRAVRRTVVAAVDSDNGSNVVQPTANNVPDAARWGGVTAFEGAIGVIDEVEFRFGGGEFNLTSGTDSIRPVLNFLSTFGRSLGTRFSVTNNDFNDNFEAAIGMNPDGLLAADPLRPLASGHPFFRGNVMQRNTYNGLRVYTLPADVVDPSSTRRFGIAEATPAFNNINQTVSTVWDSTDLTYILRGTIQLDGRDEFIIDANGRFVLNELPNANQFTGERTPHITLTVQSALPNTLLANGQRIGTPGESSLLKLLSFYQAAGNAVDGSSDNSVAGAGFIVGVDDGIDPDARPLVDPGVGSQIRIVGIPANETTQQQRVPVIITSLLDDSVGKTVRGVDMSNAFPNLNPSVGFDPILVNPDQSIRDTPAPGDGGLIYFGGLSLFDYNLYDPRNGSIIDNADIRFMTRVEVQGGGIIDVVNRDADAGFAIADNLRDQALGRLPINQNNASQALTISNSNLANFSQVGVISHPGFNAIIRDVSSAPGSTAVPISGLTIQRAPFRGQPVHLFLVNNTFSNMPTGVRVNSETTEGPFSQGDSQQQVFVTNLLNNTFFNTATGLRIQAPPGTFNPNNSNSGVVWLAMNNIFANNSVEAITTDGQQIGSQGQYNLFNNNASIITIGPQGVRPSFAGNNAPIFGDPQFLNAAAGDFRLGSQSAAIDSGRSEFGPNIFGNSLRPIATQTFDGSRGVRTFGGRTGTSFRPEPSDLVTLPGFGINSNGFRNFQDQFIPNPNGGGGSKGTGGNVATYPYTPLGGERDLNGFLRQDENSRNNVGTGNRPFFDVGAHEFRALISPKVVAFADNGFVARASTPNGAVDLYGVGNILGANQTPQAIEFAFDRRIDGNSVTGQTILLQASGGDGIFGNNNATSDRFIDLTGKVSLVPGNSRVVRIDIGAAGVVLGSDLYRIILVGTGRNVIRDNLGNALDGENLDANGNQRPVPSGDGFPGGNFQVTFSIDTNAPSIVNGTFRLDPATDSNRQDAITRINQPAFLGRVTDTFPPVNFLAGQTVVLEILDQATGQFVQAGSTFTDAQGNFRVAPSRPLGDTPYNVGPDGILGTGDDQNYDAARAYAIDQNGNRSANFGTAGFVVDTLAPRIIGLDPAPGTLVGPDASGRVFFRITFDENIDPATLNAQTILVTRADSVPAAIDPASIVIEYLGGTRRGPVRVSFALAGPAANVEYTISVVGASITDIAGNPLAGGFEGVFPPGTVPPGGGPPVNPTFPIFNPGAARIRYVGQGFGGPGIVGSRNNPYTTINEAITSAVLGDVVAVLPGVYGESIQLKSFVRVVSADFSSNDGQVFPGNAQATIIRPVFQGQRTITVQADNLLSLGGIPTEFIGFTVAAPLVGDPALGFIDPDSIGLISTNSDILIARNYFVDAGYGMVVGTLGNSAPTARVESNGLIGNGVGILVNDNNVTGSVVQPIRFANNTVAFNTTGMVVAAAGPAPLMVDVVNNIFWQNHDNSSGRNGAAIIATLPNKASVRFNLFSGNGPDQLGYGDETVNVGGGLNPAALNAQPDGLGNFVGEPSFVSPRDPRPDGDGPATFFLEGNFDLRSNSAAIDNALGSLAPQSDFRFRSRIDAPGSGFPGRGPADLGAFEFAGAGGIAAGAAFRVSNNSAAPDNGDRLGGATIPSRSAPSSMILTFSARVDRSSVSTSDLVFSGDGLNGADPIRAVGVNFIDDFTVQFLLAGSYNPSGTGTIFYSLADGSILSAFQQAILGYNDSFILGPDGSLTPGTPGAPVIPGAPGAPIAPGTPGGRGTPIGGVPPRVGVPVPTGPIAVTPPPAAPPTRGRNSAAQRRLAQQRRKARAQAQAQARAAARAARLAGGVGNRRVASRAITVGAATPRGPVAAGRA